MKNILFLANFPPTPSSGRVKGGVVRDVVTFETKQAVVHKHAVKRLGLHTDKANGHEVVVGAAMTLAAIKEQMAMSKPEIMTALERGLLRATQAPMIVFCRQIYGCAYLMSMFRKNSTVLRPMSIVYPTSCLDRAFERDGEDGATAPSSLYAVDRDAPGGYVDLLSYMEPSIFSHVNAAGAAQEHSTGNITGNMDTTADSV
jgi:hypothetical protein